MPNPTSTPNSKQKIRKLFTPKTDVSISDEKATQRFVLAMIAVIVAIAIIGGGILYWLVTGYARQSLKNKSQDKTIGLLETKKKDLVLLKPNLERITADNSSGKSSEDLIISAIPTDEAFPRLIAMLERMGEESGVKISSIAKSTQAAGTTQETAATASTVAQSYDFTVGMDGEFNRVLEFIRKTEKSARVMDFVSMDFSGSTKSGQVTATATFKAYYQPAANIAPTEEELK